MQGVMYTNMNDELDMNGRIYIPSRQLIKYVNENEVMWQFCDSVIEVSYADQSMIPKEEKDEYEDRNNNMLSIIQNAGMCSVFNPKSDNCKGLENLLEWADEQDLLILVDGILLICIASCDKKKVLAMAV